MGLVTVQKTFSWDYETTVLRTYQVQGTTEDLGFLGSFVNNTNCRSCTLTSGIVTSGYLGNGAVNSGNIASGQIGASHISSGTLVAGPNITITQTANNIIISATSGGVSSGSVQGYFGSRNIASGTVGVYDFGSGAVIAGTVGSGAILSGNIGSGQVGAVHLASGFILPGNNITIIPGLSGYTINASSTGLTSGSVTSGYLGNSSVVSGSIGSGQVGVYHLQSGLVTSGLYLSGSIGSGQVGAVHLASGFILPGSNITITPGLSGYTITASSTGLTSGSVTSGFLGNSSVVSGSIGSGQIGVYHLQSGLVTSGLYLSGSIGSGQISAAHLASGFIIPGSNITIVPGLSGYTISATGSSLTSGSVQSGNIGSGAVQGYFGSTRNIASGTVGVYDFGSGAVIAGTVGSGAILSGSIGSGQVGAAHLASGFILPGNNITITPGLSGYTITATSTGLTSGSVTSGYLGNSSVVSGSIGSGQVGAVHLASGFILPGTNITIVPGLSGYTISTTGSSLTSGSVTSGFLGNSSVVSGSIGSGQIGVYHLQSGLVTSGLYLSGSIGSGQIGAVHLASGFILPGTNITIVPGLSGYTINATTTLSSGQVQSGNIGSGAVQGYFGSRNIASGTVGVYDFGSGAVIAGTVGSGAIQSGNIGSGQISTYHLASGATITRAQFTAPFVSGTAWTVLTEEPVSGVRAVSLSQSGNVRVAMASVSGRMPAVGIVVDNVASGIQANVYTAGSFQVTSGLVDYSGYIGQSLYVGRSGQIVTASGSFNSGGLLSGDFVQFVGTAFNSGNILAELGQAFQAGIVQSGNIGSGQIGAVHLASGFILPGTNITIVPGLSGYTISTTGSSLTSGSVTSGFLGNSSVVSGSIGSGQIGVYHLQSGLVTSGLYLSGSIGSGQIGAVHLASGFILPGSNITIIPGLSGYTINSITTLTSGQVLSGNIGSGQIGVYHLQSGLVTSGLYLSGSIGSGQIGVVHLASGFILPGSNITITPGLSGYTITATGSSLTSGSVQSGNIGSGAVQGYFGSTRNIASGTVGVYDFGSGAVIAGTVGSGAIQSGNIASGQISTYHLASGATITRSQFSAPFVSGTPWTVLTEEPVSGVRAVALSQSGNVRIAMASVSGRMPAIGIVVDNVASGIQANVYTAGSFQVTSGLADYSGYIGQNLYVGRSGQIVTASGSFNSGGLLSGDFVQLIGAAFNSGNILAELGQAFQLVVALSGNIGSGQIGAVHLSSGFILPGTNITIVPGLSGYTINATTTVTSGQIQSGNIGSGTVQGYFGSRNIASGTVGVYDFGSGAVIAGTVGSGAIQSGNIASGQVTWQHFASGVPCVIASGTSPANPTIGEFWLNTAPVSGSSLITSGMIAPGAVTSGNLASGVITAYPNLDAGQIQGFPVTWLTSSTIQVGNPNPILPNSAARDKNDTGTIAMSGTVTVNINTSGAGGVDTAPMTGTVFTVANATLVSGSATAFLTDFGTRNTGASVAASGTTLTVVGGTNLSFPGMVAVGDMLGNTSGYFSISAISSGAGAFTITSGFIASGTVASLIENPTFGYSGSFGTIAAIYTNTSMLLTSGASATISGTGIKGGKVPGIYMYAWAGQGISGSTCWLSTQRTSPYGV